MVALQLLLEPQSSAVMFMKLGNALKSSPR